MEQLIQIAVDDVTLEGMLGIPKGASGMVLFAHGSGSSRLSPRNNFVAKVLREAGMGTLLIDLLTPQEDQLYENRFNINLLTERLIKIISWLKNQPQTQHLLMGLFGASTGAAAALNVAATLSSDIAAVVSRGGRPDLAIDLLGKVIAPTLLIVGGNDFVVIDLNQQAYQELQCVKKLEIIKGATHLFEEPGALEKVAELARGWFQTYSHERRK